MSATDHSSAALRLAVEQNAPEVVQAMQALVGEVPALARVPLLAAPFVLPSNKQDEITRACRLLISALLRIAGPERWNPAIPRPAGLEELIESEALTLPRLGACRLDALCQPDGSALRFLEIQASDPTGQGLVDAMTASLAQVAALQPWVSRASSLVEARRALVTRAIPSWRARVAFVNLDDAFLVADTELMARAFRKAGHEAVRIDPRNLEWDGRTLSAHDHVIDAVMRDSHEELTVSPGGATPSALWSAFQAGIARFNPFRDLWFDDKASFALLWEQRHTLPPDELESVEAHVPETRLVQRADLEQLRRTQTDWVLKPAKGYGGFGVVIGCDVDGETWSRAVDLALRERTIAQRFVPLTPQPAAFLAGDAIEWRSQHLTFSFWCHDGQYSGAFGRAGSGRVINVHQGGGIGPLVFSAPPTL